MKEGEDMKKYTLTLLFFTMFAWMFQNIYATDEFTFEEVNIGDEVTLNGSKYEEGIEVKETGNITTLRFYASYANGEAAYPAVGIKIDVFYNDSNGRIRPLTSMRGFEKIELISNEKGEIVIENLPYGMYTYVITETPSDLNVSKSENDSFEVTPFDYDVEVEYILPIKVTVVAVAGKAYLFNPEDKFIIGKSESKDYYDPRPTYEIMGDTNTPVTQDISIDNPDKANGAVNSATTQTAELEATSNTQEDYNPSVTQVKVLGNLYESAKTDFTIKEDVEDINIEDIPLSATIPVRIEMSKKDAIAAMRQIRITEQIKIATTNMDSTLSELYRLSNVPDDKKR